ncbi:MAG: beta-propeller domain-containing protein [Candidatus Pacebacteria bacterium]|nr:beta-propeller domain-containing protein [Candidatus Paceibacterota bacterium]
MNTNDEKNKSAGSSSNYSKETLELEKKKLRSKNKMIFLSFFISFILIIFVIGGLIVALMTTNRVNKPNKPSIPIVEEEYLGNYVKKFENYSQMQDFMNERSAIASGYGDNYFGGTSMLENRTGVMKEESIDGWGSAEASATTNDSAKGIGGSEDYSTTNIQIGGVDEGDIVKNDGKYIYAISGNDVVIVDAFPAEDSSEVSRIKLNTKPSGIYINDDKILVYGRSYLSSISSYRDMVPKNRFQNYSYVKIYNISDRSNPKEIKSYDFEGNLSDSRMIGDYIYFVTSNNLHFYDKNYPVPLLVEDGKLLGSDPKNVNCSNCPDVYYFDMNYYSYNFTTVSAININDLSGNIKSEVYMLDGYQNNLFVSLENLYITYNKRVSEEELVSDIVLEIIKEKISPQLTQRDRELIEKIENSDDDLLSPMEKYEKIVMIMAKYENLFSENESVEIGEELKRRVKERYEDISKELEKTVIHKIGINDGDLKYKTSGEVTGVVLNQFSMDENNGYFRIATTKNRSWSSLADTDQKQSYSNLYVLDNDMKVVGKVEGLAKGERIYSVRFMQNRAYLVTFKRVDPLFVIDLTNPENPKVMGELKVPGYSSYLHPYDDVTLIGLGKETDDTGRIIGGIKLSLFDVSDVKNPKEIDKFVLGDRSSNSIAINEHKAFLFSKDKNLLAIPVTMQEDIVKVQESAIFEEEMIMPSVRKYFNGVAVFNINKKGFELKGKIDHSDDENKSWDRSGNVQRSLYIDNVLYTLSNKYLKANGLNDLNEIKNIELVDNHN